MDVAPLQGSKTVTMVRRGGKKLVHTLRHPNQVDPKSWAKMRRTACGKNLSRRYTAGHNMSRHQVNCRACLLALVNACTLSEFLNHIGHK